MVKFWNLGQKIGIPLQNRVHDPLFYGRSALRFALVDFWMPNRFSGRTSQIYGVFCQFLGRKRQLDYLRPLHSLVIGIFEWIWPHKRPSSWPLNYSSHHAIFRAINFQSFGSAQNWPKIIIFWHQKLPTSLLLSFKWLLINTGQRKAIYKTYEPPKIGQTWKNSNKLKRANLRALRLSRVPGFGEAYLIGSENCLKRQKNEFCFRNCVKTTKIWIFFLQISKKTPKNMKYELDPLPTRKCFFALSRTF